MINVLLSFMDVKKKVPSQIEEVQKNYKYKVHSAIYSWSDPKSEVTITHDVSKTAQDLLNDPTTNGIIHITNDNFPDPAPEHQKSFAIIVSIVCPEGKDVTKFCSGSHGDALNTRKSGVQCYF